MRDDESARSFKIDAPALAVAVATALRRAGIPSTPERSAWLVEALRIDPPNDKADLYWACRVVFVTSLQQVARFDAVFEAIFGGAVDIADSRGAADVHDAISTHRRGAEDRKVADVPRGGADDSLAPASASSDHNDESGDQGEETDAFLLAASREERLHETSFAELDAAELADIRRLVAALAVTTPMRAGRRERQSQHSRDRLDMRRTVRAAARTGGDPVRLFHARPRKRPRSLVLLCDVSASMDPYTRVFVSFMQAAVVSRRAEAFIFATRLTRLTRHLAVSDPDKALERAAAGTQDWAGGTRLADGLRSFIDEYGRRGIARGAVVVILSDGWAQDRPEDIRHQMGRLSRLAHRIVWVNPRKAARDYQPLAGGMAAALPYCDAFVSGHTYSALQELVGVIAEDPAPQPSVFAPRVPAPHAMN